MKKKTICYGLIFFLIILIVILMDYFSVISLGIYTKTYKGEISDSYYTFRYSSQFKVDDYGTHLMISKPEYLYKENKPFLSLYFYENKDSENNTFDNLEKWYDYFYKNENRAEIKEIDWLNQKAIKAYKEFAGIGEESKEYFIGIISYYAFFQNRDYIIEINDGSRSVYPYKLEKEFNNIINSFRFIN